MMPMRSRKPTAPKPVMTPTAMARNERYTKPIWRISSSGDLPAEARERATGDAAVSAGWPGNDAGLGRPAIGSVGIDLRRWDSMADSTQITHGSRRSSTPNPLHLRAPSAGGHWSSQRSDKD